MTLAEFNALPSARAESLLLDCCGCAHWAAGVSAQRPFADLSALHAAAESHWLNMDREDWLQAFSHHPQIGEKTAAGSDVHRRWSEGEQTGVKVATEEVKTRLARGNRAYFDKFGHIFMVCATGKSAEEMLALLEQRLQNDPNAELPVATDQQRQISRLRMQKLLVDERTI